MNAMQHRTDYPIANEILDAFAAGDMGRVEFFELALEAGMTLEEISAALEEVDEF